MSFQSKKVGNPQPSRSRKDRLTSPFAVKFYTTICIGVVFFILGSRTIALLEQPAKEAITNVTKIVSKSIGEPMEQDKFGKVNVLIAGYAWNDYRGGLLTDTMMVASFDPKLGAVTFVSVPRDLYVNYDNWGSWRLNGHYRSHYLQWEREHGSGAAALMSKLSDITWIQIAYHAFIDFDGFISFINEIEGVEVDVPESLYDNQFPWPNDSYTVFEVEQWVQQFDGETALKYARSRKSTSDFSRALRQQQIIAATIKQLTSKFSLTKVGSIKSLYDSAMEVVQTDIPLQQLLSLAQYAEWDKHFFSFVYTAECNWYDINFAEPWCLLYYADRASFGWQAVMLPVWAAAWALSNYEQTSRFWSRVSLHQETLIEWAQITVYNAMDKQRARNVWKSINWVASDFAIDLIEYGFAIEKVNNALVDQDQISVVVSKTWANANTIWSLRSFIDNSFEVIVDPLIASWRAWENIMHIILGYEYLQ